MPASRALSRCRAHRRWSALLLAPAVFMAGGVGCADQGAFVPEEEPLVPEAEVEAMTEVLGLVDSFFASEAWQSLRDVGPALLEGGIGGGPSASGQATAAQGIPAVPPRLLGKTMVYDESVGRYVEDGGRLGAPGNGVRIVIYRPATNRLNEIGWLDVVEAGSSLPNTYRVQVTGVERGAGFANYSTTVTGPAGPGLLRPTSIELDGSVVAGKELLTFDIDSRVPDPFDPTLDIDWQFDLQSLGLSIQATVSGVPITGQGVENLDFNVVYLGSQWNVDLSDDAGTIDALVRYNGRELATATGVISQPTVIGSAAQQLPQNLEFLVVRILSVAVGVFETHNDLFTPPGSVIFFGL